MLNGNTDSGFKNGTPSKTIQVYCDCVVGSLQNGKACVLNDPEPGIKSDPGINGTKETIFSEKSNQLVVDFDFSALIPPLQPDERLLLEESLFRDGCRDALVVWAEESILLDGHNRLEICRRLNIPYETVGISLPDREAAADWIDANQLARRNLHPDQASIIRGRRYNRVKTAQGGDHKSKGQNDTLINQAETLAKQHGVSPATIKRDGQFAAAVEKVTALDPEIPKKVTKGEAPAKSHIIKAAKLMDEHPEKAAAVLQGKAKISSVIREIKKEERERDLDEARQQMRNVDISDVCDIRHCSADVLLSSGIRPDCIITDPPYPREYLPLYGLLAEKAVDVPLVAVMCGQTYLPEIMETMCRHLKYRWTLAYLTPGGKSVQQWPCKVNTFWKPVLIFGEALEWIGDVCSSKTNDNDKRFHDWGQSESGMADLVERLTKPGDLVCDPFAGAGTTAVVSLQLGRRFVGCDIDQACVGKGLARCQEVMSHV